MLFLEGSTDLAILQGFATKLSHARAEEVLKRPFVRYIGNKVGAAANHFHGLREACPSLVGFALFDRLDKELPGGHGLTSHMWMRREIENYLCTPETRLSWARAAAGELFGPGPLFETAWENVMRDCIAEIEAALRTLNKPSPWDSTTKVTDDFLDPLFDKFFKALRLPDLMLKKDYHLLVTHVPDHQIDAEITRVLDQICATASRAAETEDERHGG